MAYAQTLQVNLFEARRLIKARQPSSAFRRLQTALSACNGLTERPDLQKRAKACLFRAMNHVRRMERQQRA